MIKLITFTSTRLIEAVLDELCEDEPDIPHLDMDPTQFIKNECVRQLLEDVIDPEVMDENINYIRDDHGMFSLAGFYLIKIYPVTLNGLFIAEVKDVNRVNVRKEHFRRNKSWKYPW